MKRCIWLTSALSFVAIITMSSEAGSPTNDVTFIDSDKVAAAFAKGTPLLESDKFKVHASRRDAPGVAEIHTRDTDIIHVLEGSATLVTGGTAVEPKTIATDEIRGKEIQGGESRRIGGGDVIIIPNGVPHWFKQVDAPLLYYVVKVRK
ncbi:MAG TPA: cupin domain-containing protein [Haliangiales bacterium]|nr:cupin domain-containing protein [Haliangiales bacterium]